MAIGGLASGLSTFLAPPMLKWDGEQYSKYSTKCDPVQRREYPFVEIFPPGFLKGLCYIIRKDFEPRQGCRD